MMLLNMDSTIQGSSRRFCTVYKWVKYLQFSGRHDISSGRSTVQASFVRTTRTFHLDLPLCREASNCSSLPPFERFNSRSGHHSVFDHLWDFFPKHRYEKTAATVWTMWIPVRTHSSIRQVVHSKSKCSDTSLHGPDTRATYSEISSVRTACQNSRSFEIGFQTQKQLTVRTRVPETPILTRIRTCKAYK